MKLDIKTASTVDEKDKIEYTIQQQIKKFQKLVSTQTKVPGHILWEYNVRTKSLERAKFDNVSIKWNWDPKKIISNAKVLVKVDCIYIQALNEVNAWKRIKRLEE